MLTNTLQLRYLSNPSIQRTCQNLHFGIFFLQHPPPHTHTLFKMMFLVGAFPLREKCPTIAVTVFFFRLQSSHGTLLIFFGTATFFRNFLTSPKGPPLSFLLFCNRMQVYKSQRVPLLHFLALCDIFRKKKISKISSFFPKKCFALFEP